MPDEEGLTIDQRLKIFIRRYNLNLITEKELLRLIHQVFESGN